MADDRDTLRDLHRDRFWDGLVRGDEDGAEGVDAEEADAVRAFQRLAEAPIPARARTTDWRATRARVESRRREKPLIQTTTPLRLPPDVSGSNGRADKNRTRMAARPVRLQRGGRALRLLAVAAVIVFGLGGMALSAATGSWPFGESRHASIPAPQVSPEASPTPAPAGLLELLWETRGDLADPMGSAPFIAVAPDGTIWVTDESSDKIRIFSPDGTLLEVWNSPGTGEGQFDFTLGSNTGVALGAIAFDAAGNAYVLDAGNHRVQKFDPDGAFLAAWGSEGYGERRFVSPSDIAVDAQGRIITVDGFRNIPGETPDDAGFVQVVDGNGRFLLNWGPPTVGPEPGKLMNPLGLDIGPDGTVLVTDGAVSTIEQFTPEGRYLDTVGGFGEEDGRFFQLKDVAVDAQGRIYATDWAKHRITVLDRDGRFLATWGETGTGPGQLHFPYGVALDGEGNLYVTDDNGRLQRFRLPPLPETAAPPAT